MIPYPWWTLPLPTVDGRYYLDCHYTDRAHRAVIVNEPRACDGCTRLLTGHAWAPLDRSRVLCAKCHGDAHRGDDELRANAVDPYGPDLDGHEQLTIEVPGTS